MRVVHVATLQDGGAGIAAMRLHEGLLAEGIDSTFLCAYPKKIEPALAVATSKPKTYGERALRKIGYESVDKVHREMKKVKRANGNYEYYSLPFSNYELQKNPIVLGADVINFHWVSNFVDFPTFFSINKPIVWTLHDMNPFLGGFHYGADLAKNSDNTLLMGLERSYKQVKAEAIRNRNLNICSPSRWLYEESLSDKAMSQFPHHYIPYGLDTDLFKNYPKELSREVFKIPLDKKIFLFISANIQNTRKGFNFLKEAIHKISRRDDCIVVAAGNHPPADKDPNILYLDAIHDDIVLPLLFSAADACVIPSLEDNLPNVMLEALSCGIPVLGFATGGLKDTIIDGFNGFISAEASADSLAGIMEKFLDCRFDPSSIRSDSAKKFHQSVQAKKYIDLYRAIVLQHNH